MAAQGYIAVAPNRRGMPGTSKWNEQISKDHGGQNMKDYLSAIDDIAKEPFVDRDRMGCVEQVTVAIPFSIWLRAMKAVLNLLSRTMVFSTGARCMVQPKNSFL